MQQVCRDNGALSVRLAKDEAERAALWAGRKGAFAAIGRLTPDYYTVDGTAAAWKDFNYVWSTVYFNHETEKQIVIQVIGDTDVVHAAAAERGSCQCAGRRLPYGERSNHKQQELEP